MGNQATVVIWILQISQANNERSGNLAWLSFQYYKTLRLGWYLFARCASSKYVSNRDLPTCDISSSSNCINSYINSTKIKIVSQRK